MEGAAAPTPNFPLHSLTYSRRNAANRLFAVVYAAAIFALLYHNTKQVLQSTTIASLFISLSLLLSNAILGFMWFTTQSCRMNTVYRKTYPENLHKVVEKKDFPAMDIFICTANPYKEPPMGVVNTALSVMAYDYPTEKLSVYVSDDGGSPFTLFAFMEAARFAKHWLPFCRRNNIDKRSPEAFFGSMSYSPSSETHDIKIMYERIKSRVDGIVEAGKIDDEYVTSEEQREALSKWTEDFTSQDHPTIIQVLLEAETDIDITNQPMPNLVYVSRGKSKASPHHFKAGALNALLRVSGIMTNAPLILTQDCDMYSNDPQTPLRTLCYFSDPALTPKLGYVQFPQRFHGLNKSDIYASELKRIYVVNPVGMDGLAGTCYVGTGCFFSRRVFFGGPTSFVTPELAELRPDTVVQTPINSESLIKLARRVADCNYENQTHWGSLMGFRYGSLVEDYYTGYMLQCEGWKSVFCNPNRPAFLGDVPISLNDALSQAKRWSVGFLEVGFSKFSPVTYGCSSMGLLMGACYAYYAFWPIWSIPIIVYSFLPQITLLNGLAIFPKVSDFWFKVYAFLFLGGYGQDCLDFMLHDGTLERWWSDQRMWVIRGLTCQLFALVEYVSKRLGIATQGFNLTNKFLDEELSKRYDQGVFEFGVESPLFIPLATTAIINLFAFIWGSVRAMIVGKSNILEGQMLVVGFLVLNLLPIYKAMLWRTDRGRMQPKTTFTSLILAVTVYAVVSLALQYAPK